MINRNRLVSRHNPQNTEMNALSPFTVGNGEFAFTADITGLQTFSSEYASGIPLCTQAQWGWHTYPCSADTDTKKINYRYHSVSGRKIPYLSMESEQKKMYQFLRHNPHRLHLGKIGFIIIKSDGEKADLTDIDSVKQELNLWEGTIISRFSLEGVPVSVITCCDPVLDVLAVTVDSPLLHSKQLQISFDFPYGSTEIGAACWENEKSHKSLLLNKNSHLFCLKRVLDQDYYFVSIQFNSDVRMVKNGRHKFIFSTVNNGTMAFCSRFSKQYSDLQIPYFTDVYNAAVGWWKNFWETGAAVELIKSTDTRAFELERRIVLSQYLTAIQCAGSLPPQETGLTCNAVWYGKFHLEMHWWHAAQFPYWNRCEMLKKSLRWYKEILYQARNTAKAQGYKGVRWPKMTGYNGLESPSNINPYLIWQQPHIIYFAEQIYRQTQSRETLVKYSELVMKTAEFMADYAIYEQHNNRYVLGPALIPAQEAFSNPDTVINPTFELEYWHWGLKTAQKWRERLGLERNPQWDSVLNNLSELPVDVQEHVYLAHEKAPDTYSDKNNDHPSMLYALGVLPGEKVNPHIMLNTLCKIIKEWKWETSWGWDFSMAAMTAVRLNRPDLAIDILLMNSPKNTFLKNGHNYQNKELPLYLPGNGGLLTAVAMMCAGYEGDDNIHNPGFPNDGSWTVEWEGLKKII